MRVVCLAAGRGALLCARRLSAAATETSVLELCHAVPRRTQGWQAMPATHTSMMAPYWSHTARLLVVTSCNAQPAADEKQFEPVTSVDAAMTPGLSSKHSTHTLPVSSTAVALFRLGTQAAASNTSAKLLQPHLHIEHEACQLLWSDGSIPHHAASQ